MPCVSVLKDCSLNMRSLRCGATQEKMDTTHKMDSTMKMDSSAMKTGADTGMKH